MHFKKKEGEEEVFEDITAASELCNAMRLVEGKYYEQMPSSAVVLVKMDRSKICLTKQIIVGIKDNYARKLHVRLAKRD
jgi:hypothetical protein